MSAPYHLRCPCGQLAHGPYYDAITNRLVYRCRCGYEVPLPPEDEEVPGE